MASDSDSDPAAPGLAGSDVVLRDGRTVHIRPVSPADEAEFLQAFERLSSEARYMRFMRVVHEPDRARLRAVLASFPEHGVGFVATVPAEDGVDIVGSAVSVFPADKASCEFAITVASGFGGLGLARTLMTALIDQSRRRGVKQMEGYVLAQNQSMLGLARRLGFAIEREPGHASVRICRLPLNPP